MSHCAPLETGVEVWWRFPPLRNALIAGLLVGGVLLLEFAGAIPTSLATFAYLAAIPLGGAHWIKEGLRDLVEERRIGIEVLMLAATIGAGWLGMWDEAATLVILYGIAESIEEYTYARTRLAVRALLDLAPKRSQILLVDGTEKSVFATELVAGDRMMVRPGEALATDGVIEQGRSDINEAPITGESAPVDKAPGDSVFAATINGSGALIIRVTRVFADNTLSRIIHLVETAQTQKGRAQQWIERFGNRYTPAVLLGSATLLVVPWALGLPIEVWAHRAIVLLVAAAPCALVMSMPMAMAAGIGGAGRRGILIKGGAHLEHLGVIRVVAFDKTGTLTAGRPTVTDVIARGVEDRRLIEISAGIERYSQHPLARAIVSYAESRGFTPTAAHGFESLTGAGACARVDETLWTIGSPTWFRQRNAAIGDLESEIARLESSGKTVVLLAEGQALRGLIALRDEPRAEAAAAVSALHGLGVRTAMLTGDNRRTGDAIARQIGIDDVRAEVRPEGKVDAVADLERRYGPVLMVGDGINDAPALAAATCGLAMGAVGTDAAIEAADVTLMGDDLRKVAEAITGARKARRVSLQNIVLSIAVLATMIPLAVAGIIGITMAVAVHETAEILAVLNGLRAGAPGDAYAKHPGPVPRPRAWLRRAP